MREIRGNSARVWVLVLALSALTACGGSQDRASEYQALLEAQDYEEIEARVKLAREAGETGPWLDFAEGLALLEEGSDNLAFRLFDSVAEEKPELALAAAETLVRRAEADVAAGWEKRPTLRMIQAIKLNPNIPPGELIDSIADHLYRFRRDYHAAYPLYRTLVDSARAQGADGDFKAREWLFRYGYCLETQDARAAAMMVYREFQDLYPDDLDQMRAVMWRYMEILIEEAEALRELSDLDAAMQKLEETQETEWHMDLQQRARYLAGEIEQSRGRMEEARRWYQMVISEGSVFGSEIVDAAKFRMDELRSQGVH